MSQLSDTVKVPFNGQPIQVHYVFGKAVEPPTWNPTPSAAPVGFGAEFLCNLMPRCRNRKSYEWYIEHVVNHAMIDSARRDCDGTSVPVPDADYALGIVKCLTDRGIYAMVNSADHARVDIQWTVRVRAGNGFLKC